MESEPGPQAPGRPGRRPATGDPRVDEAVARLDELAGLPLRYIIHPDVSSVNFYHFIIVAILVWHGLRLARETASLTSIQASFQLWLIALLFYGMFFGPLYPGQATFGLYTFIFSGLVSMSAARVANLSDLRGGRIPRFGLGWLGGITLSALAVVGLAILVSWLASGWVARILSGILVAILATLTTLVFIILSPLLYYLADILPRLADFLQQILARLQNLTSGNAFSKLIETMSEELAKVLPYILAARVVFLVVVLGGLVLLVILALYIRSRRDLLLEEEEAGHNELENINNPLRRMIHHLARRLRSLRFGNAAGLLAAARIRRVYRHLMALSKRLGAERPPSVTPLEFLPKLNELFPSEEGGLDTITRAYLKVRYGEYPETRQEVTAVEQAWEQVRQKGRKRNAR